VTETEGNVNVGGMYSKFWRISLVIIAMLLLFVGPTYVPYAMFKLNIDYVATVGVGAALFIVGIAFTLYLVQKKIITA
jgi:hypothetical protein